MRERTNNDLNTPEWILDLVRMLGPIELDPCSNPWSKVDAKRSFDIDRGEDGLALPWGQGLVFVNPPYGRGHMDKWASKIKEEGMDGTEIVALVKGDFSTEWWKILRECADAICYLNQRVSYDGGKFGSGNFPSSLFYFGRKKHLFAYIFEHKGDVRLL